MDRLIGRCCGFCTDFTASAPVTRPNSCWCAEGTSSSFRVPSTLTPGHHGLHKGKMLARRRRHSFRPARPFGGHVLFVPFVFFLCRSCVPFPICWAKLR